MLLSLQQALEDFRDRIAKYEEVYETITDRNLHYIKLIDMCACRRPSLVAPHTNCHVSEVWAARVCSSELGLHHAMFACCTDKRRPNASLDGSS